MSEWTSDQQDCIEMLNDLFYGSHHVLGHIRPASRNGILINTRCGSFSTHDFDWLTRAVIMSHQRLIRFEIAPSGPGMLKLLFHKRAPHREGASLWHYHPSVDDLIKRLTN